VRAQRYAASAGVGARPSARVPGQPLVKELPQVQRCVLENPLHKLHLHAVVVSSVAGSNLSRLPASLLGAQLCRLAGW